LEDAYKANKQSTAKQQGLRTGFRHPPNSSGAADYITTGRSRTCLGAWPTFDCVRYKAWQEWPQVLESAG